MKILAVDDDPFIRELFPVMFEAVDSIELSIAEGGKQALAMLGTAEETFDCLLLDIDMPEMDGIELCKRIRALPGYAEKPILMLTARTDIVAIESAFVAGANDYISKPFNLKEIFNRIKVAERLLKLEKTVKRVDALADIDETPRGEHDFEVGDKLRLLHVERLIMSFSMGNYLTQLERGDLDNCQVFCVALDNCETLFNHSSSREFLTVLTDLANAIVETVTCPHLMISYEGKGIFACITRNPDLPEWDVIETNLQKIMDDCAYTLPVTEEVPVTVSVGTPIAPNANRTQRVKKTIERAIGRVQMRGNTKSSRSLTG